MRLNQSCTQTKRASFHTCRFKGKISNSPPQHRQQLYMYGGNKKQDQGRDDYMPDSFSGLHEAPRHHTHTPSTGQRGLQCIERGNMTFRYGLPIGTAWRTPAQPRRKVNTNVEIPFHRSSVWNGSTISHEFVVPTDPPSRKTTIIAASSILKSKFIRICQPTRSPWLQR